MSHKLALQIFHGILLAGFLSASVVAVQSLFTSDDLNGTIAGATVAALIATFSAFLERIFPLDEE